LIPEKVEKTFKEMNVECVMTIWVPGIQREI
jgi:hypothetical protein